MKRPVLFRWQYGRQRSGYRVFCFWNWLSCDGYVIHIPPGTTIAPHRDVVDGKLHFRLNIDLWGRCRMIVDKTLWRFWRFTLFRPDAYLHSVPPSTKAVWLLSFGTALGRTLPKPEPMPSAAEIRQLPKWTRWGPNGGPKVVYECAEQPDYAIKSGTVVVWASVFGEAYGKIQIKPWYYRREEKEE